MTTRPQTVDAIIRIEPRVEAAEVPPLSDYVRVSPGWTEAEFTCFCADAGRVRVAFWSGEAGEVALDPWPYTEVCSILSGRVVVSDSDGGRVEFVTGDAFVIPKGFSGSWTTLVPSTKLFVAIE